MATKASPPLPSLFTAHQSNASASTLSAFQPAAWIADSVARSTAGARSTSVIVVPGLYFVFGTLSEGKTLIRDEEDEPLSEDMAHHV